MNEQFLKRMKDYLNDEYDTYIECLQQPLYRGLRINETKSNIDEVAALLPCHLTPSAICSQSFYIPEETKQIGNHPAHLAGLFYMQEPSAASAVEVLDVNEHEWVLDLCAAPGGKSTQIAERLRHTGFLVSNEIDHRRAMILLSNMERMGVSECMITNAYPDVLCKEMAGCFDKVLVDAPCSGEGMFKKHSKAMEDWSIQHVEACAQRQLQILDSAYTALKENGIIVYSTCTFSMEENEQVIYQFLQTHPDMELIDSCVHFGRPGFIYKNLDIHKVRRILPMEHGEGHFVAKMIKRGQSLQAKRHEVNNISAPKPALDFFKQQLTHTPVYVMQHNDAVYLKQTPFLKLKKTRILRQGIMAGELKKQRFEPHQHFYMASLLQNEHRQYYDMTDRECALYLQGNPLSIQGYKGYTLLTWHNHPIAFAKGDGYVLKNKYPKGLRI